MGIMEMEEKIRSQETMRTQPLASTAFPMTVTSTSVWKKMFSTKIPLIRGLFIKVLFTLPTSTNPLPRYFCTECTILSTGVPLHLSLDGTGPDGRSGLSLP
uniref:Uncharacterized protein n=1 Tax=Schistocephalus solidus TaxID=70667 RepID=A0A0X3P8L5_SCHSO